MEISLEMSRVARLCAGASLSETVNLRRCDTPETVMKPAVAGVEDDYRDTIESGAE